MSTLLATMAQALHVALMLAAAPMLVGYVRLLKARLTGRRGPGMLQPYRDLLRLSRKLPVVPDSASPLFRAAPAVLFVSSAAACALVPAFADEMLLAPASDLLVFAGLLAIGRCALALAAMDAGTAFGGIGASREMTFAALAEPGLLLVAFTLALLAGTTNLDVIVATLQGGSLGLRVSLGLALVTLLTVALAEAGRMPVDNPATHLELTMVHEAMVLEYSGGLLALVEWAAALRLLVWCSLIAAVFAPVGIVSATGFPLAWLAGAAIWAVKLGLLATALAVMESAIAKLRVFRVTDFLGLGVLLGVLAVVFLFVSQSFP